MKKLVFSILCVMTLALCMSACDASNGRVNRTNETSSYTGYSVSSSRNNEYVSSRYESRVMRDTDTTSYSSDDGIINDVGSMVGAGVRDVGDGIENIGSTLESNVDDMFDGKDDTENY